MGNTKTKSHHQMDHLDGLQIHPTNVRYQHRPATGDPRRKKKNAAKFLDGEQIDVLNLWVTDNIRKKECVSFIPKVTESPSNQETCSCGHTRPEHHKNCRFSSVEPGTVWDPQKHVQEYPTDAHGDMIFTGTTRTWAKQWNLSVPNLLISVTGGAKNFNISSRLQEYGAWIITGGTHAGVMKHVGEAIRDFSGGENESEIVLIGIATWGIVHNRKSLISAAGGAPAEYPMDEGSQGGLCCLDNNHTHFILVDDGTYRKYGVEIPLRTKLEQYISEQTVEKGGTTIKIPIVCVVLEGGPGTLDTIYSSMCDNTPCVIVEGSGRVADIIAQVANLSISMITIAFVKEKLQMIFNETYDTFTEAQIIMWTKKIQDIVRMGSLLTILREDRTVEQGMDVAILQALLKASRSTDHRGQENWDHQLKLAVAWDRPDIAESQIFTEDWMWKPSDLYTALMIALIDDKPSFVRLFLEHGVSLSEFVNWERLTELYNHTDPSSPIHSKLEREALLDPSHRIGGPLIKLHHVSSVLHELLGGFTEHLYPGGKSHRLQSFSHINIRISVKVKSSPDSVQDLKHPVRDLLIWCIVQNRAELAEIIWRQSPDCIVGALACCKILKALSKEEDDAESAENMRLLADLYEERAVGVFSECHKNEESRAEQLLIRVSPVWGKTTSLDLAQESQGQTFMSDSGVQMFLNKTWCGRLSVENHLMPILLCMLFIPLIYSGVIMYRPPKYGCFWKFLGFFNAPIVKFYYNVVSYIGFLWLFAYVIMIDFQDSPSWREFLLYAWVFSILCEELRQLLYDPDNLGFVIKAIQYITDFWNQVDTTALSLFIVGLVCRLVSVNTMYLGRIFLSLDFMIFCLRLLHMFTVSKVLGPKIIMLRNMIKDIFFFLFLLAIWIVCYGVAKQAILTTNETRLDWIFRNVIYGPFLTLFGEIPTEVDSLNFDLTKCSQNGTDPTMPKCVFNDGSKALFPEWLTIMLLCFYLLFASILLLNLLIAMFSYTFEKVERQTDQIWRFYRFGLIKEYNERPAAPPPFILLGHFYFLFKNCFCKRAARGHKNLRLIMDEASESSLLSWESYMRDNYLNMEEMLNSQKQENIVKDTAESVSAVLNMFKTERGSEAQQLGERLSLLEEEVAKSSQQLQWIVSALKDKGFSSKSQTLVSVQSSSQDSENSFHGSDSFVEKKPLYHVNSRILQYAHSSTTRYPVPDEMVPWEVPFPGYDPPFYIAERKDRGAYNPNAEMSQPTKKYNTVDNALDLRSSCGTYTVQDGLPLNPMGRTGIRGVGSLRWFGPNHSIHPVITRWITKANGPSDKKMPRKSLEVLVIKGSENKQWALPGGTLSPGEEIPSKLLSILNAGYLDHFLTLLKNGREVFRGYLDDPRNTDNAWIETLAKSIHLDTEETLNRFVKNLKESNSVFSLRWQLLDRKIPIYANEKEILQRTAELHGAHY
ncbi:hypothetical protein GDO86_004775 [Hymenochirus boettgeri]|uniref:Transient receptor potential cation channel subfamily M member 2 n=1 Tax=Hymenochirus boettgeri TaxID=247094 RepID=A0A8T2KCG6_9PIPI|nr:hypothetical protein GDO86_004775 [Hymenochirus boettgeri]